MDILITVADTNMGGITISAANLANELAKKQHNVYFLDLSGDFLIADILSDGIKTVKLTGREKYWNITANDRKNLPSFVHKILGVFKKVTVRLGVWYNLIFKKLKGVPPFDVAIAFRQCDACYSYVLKKVEAKKKMGFVHGELKYMGDISSWKRHMCAFDKIAYVSNAVKEQFITAYPELKNNACTIYNTFNISKIRELAKEETDVSFDNTLPNIVTVARIENSFKQIDWIVEICKRLKQLDMKFHWYVVGDGPDFEDTVQLAREAKVTDVLTFIGAKSNPYAIMDKSDFTVLVSKSEAYPMVVMESLILEKPIILAKFPSAAEMIENGKQGFIAEQSIDSVTQCIITMLNNNNNVFDICKNYLKQETITNKTAYAQFMKAIE